jgi:hypothetical protein
MTDDMSVKVRALRKALIDGENSGAPLPLNSKAFLARMRERYSSTSSESRSVIPAEPGAAREARKKRRESRNP